MFGLREDRAKRKSTPAIQRGLKLASFACNLTTTSCAIHRPFYASHQLQE